MNLADYDPNQQQKKSGQATLGDPTRPAPSINQPFDGGTPLGDPNRPPPQIGQPFDGGTPLGDPSRPAPTPQAPTTPVQAPGLTPAPAANPADPFAAQGGGVQINGNWYPKDHPGAIEWMKNNPQAAGGAPAAAPSPAAAPAPGAAPAPAPGASDPTSVYKDALVKMLGDSQTPASLNDPALKAQSDAYAVGQQRGSERDRMAAAEAMSLNGTAGINSGAFDSDVSGINERAGERQSAFNAGLVGDANKQKLGQMQSALAMMGQDINSAEGRKLQKDIADMSAQIQRDQLSQQGRQFDTDADLRRLGITTQADLGNRDLGLRDKLGSGGLNLGLLQALIGNQNFNAGLGADLGKFNASLNQNALMQLLGGL